MKIPDAKLAEPRHCDDYIHDGCVSIKLRAWLLVNRMPAIDKLVLDAYGFRPKLFATYCGRRVRVVMASRFGDVGVTAKLDDENGYQERVPVDALSNFGDAP
jgi:hypothetical protein